MGEIDGAAQRVSTAGEVGARICEQKTPNSPHNTAPHVAPQCAATAGTHSATRPQHATPRENTAP